jgi:hypothetical protein
MFGKARDTFEEALGELNKARDFGIIFNAYMKFEEGILEVDQSDSEQEDESSEEEDITDQIDALLDFTYKDIPTK